MPAESSPRMDVAALSQEGGHVLVVDDDNQLAQLYQLVLEGAGYTVTLATDGAQGLERYREAMERRHPYSLVMLDLHMPVMDGRRTLDVLRTMDSKAKVLLTTGLDAEDLGELEKRVDGVVSKPAGIRELLHAVHSVLVA